MVITNNNKKSNIQLRKPRLVKICTNYIYMKKTLSGHIKCVLMSQGINYIIIYFCTNRNTFVLPCIKPIENHIN